MARNVAQAAIFTNAPGIRRLRGVVILGVFWGLAALACSQTARPLPLPSAPAGSGCGQEMRIDWSFLGPENPERAKAQAMWIRPLPAEGNMAGDEEEQAHLRSDAVSQWVQYHARMAAAGSAAVVHLPWTRCVGWGSPTPSDYTIFGCFTPGAVFVHPKNAPAFVAACNACPPEDAACIDRNCGPRLVEGRFTGDVRTVRPDPGASELRTSYEVEVFRERETAPSRVAPDEISPDLEVVLPAGSPGPDGPPWTGERFLVAFSLDMVWAPSTRALAARKLQELADAGFSDAFVLDSRRVQSAWCCSLLVVAGTAGTRERAEALRGRLEKLGQAGFAVLAAH